MADEGRSGKSSDRVDFEVLMEFQRHVKNMFDRDRILWFNSAVSTLAEQQGTSTNEVMKQALDDFEKFVELVTKTLGPVPSAGNAKEPGGETGSEDLDDFDQLLEDE